MLGRAVLLGAAVLLPQLAKAQHTCADQNNDGVVDNGVGKQPDAFTVASCDLGYSLKADLAAATCATQVCTSAECCDAPTDKPHPVDGSGVSFGTVSPTSAKISWSKPNPGAYGASILGYDIQVMKVCAQPTGDRKSVV